MVPQEVMIMKIKPWYALTDAERAVYERRQWTAFLIFLSFLIILFLIQTFGWKIQFEKISENTENGVMTETYYDKQNDVLFHVSHVQEILLEFDAWQWVHEARETDYIVRYWYEHAKELESALAPWEFKLILNNNQFESLAIYVAGEGQAVDKTVIEIQETLQSLMPVRSRFIRFKQVGGCPAAIIRFLDCDRPDRTVRLAP